MAPICAPFARTTANFAVPSLMDFNLEEALPLLERTPTVLEAYLANLPEGWTQQNEGEGTWSPYDVVGHLIHGERSDWIPRARMILAGNAEPFPAFDRFAQFQASEGKSLAELLATFRELRAQNLDTLQGFKLSTIDLNREGFHPEFGSVTLEQLLATWVAHDQGHIVQIARTLARQYKAAVGPWKAYLGVMG